MKKGNFLTEGVSAEDYALSQENLLNSCDAF